MNVTDRELTEQLYRDIFKYAPFGIYTLDAAGTITSFNPKMTELSGDQLDDVLGKNAFEFESYKQTGLSEMFQQAIDGQPFDKKVSYTSQFGRKTTTRQYTGIPIEDRGVSGQARLLLIVEDVTERERVITELQEVANFSKQSDGPALRISVGGEVLVKNDLAAKLLEGWQRSETLSELQSMATDCLSSGQRAQHDVVVGETTYLIDIIPQTELGYANLYGRDITHERQVQAMKDHFLLVTSHELRTPMTVISGYADLLLQQTVGPITEQQREYLQKIVSNAAQLINFVNTMLDINKLESGKVDIPLRPGDVAIPVQQAVDTVRALFERSKVALSCECDHDMRAEINESELNRAVLNLLSNALKFTPSDGNVSVRVAANDQDIVISVSDTGPGISGDDQAKLFHAYAQTDIKQLHRMGGTGLGLVISREIAEAMNGRIWVESQVGHGATFFIALPKLNN